MSQLVIMRQRIKAIDTIKKITHAMRLISMSTHSRLRTKKTMLEQYTLELSLLSAKLNMAITKILQKEAGLDTEDTNNNKTNKTLHVLVGSQKGLCGNFNSSLYAFYEHDLHKNNNVRDLIIVGKKMGDYNSSIKHIICKRFDEFSMATSSYLAKELAHIILQAQPLYDSVVIYSNYPKTFFLQKAQKTILIPAIAPNLELVSNQEEYIFEQEPATLIKAISQELLHTNLKNVLLQSLIAEHAARFISMDSSTRNAHTLITTMRLEYNKLRQTKITRELTDLASNF